MATIKTTSSATLTSVTLSQTERYAIELQRIRDSHPARIAAMAQQAEDTKAIVLSLGVSPEEYDRLRNLLSKH